MQNKPRNDSEHKEVKEMVDKLYKKIEENVDKQIEIIMQAMESLESIEQIARVDDDKSMELYRKTLALVDETIKYTEEIIRSDEEVVKRLEELSIESEIKKEVINKIYRKLEELEERHGECLEKYKEGLHKLEDLEINMTYSKSIELEQALNRLGCLFWTRVVGCSNPSSSYQPSDEVERAHIIRIESYIQELNLASLHTERQKPSVQDLEVLWSTVCDKVILHVDRLTQKIHHSNEDLLYVETTTLPRLLTATFLTTIGYEDLRRLIFENRIRENTVPDNDILLFMFLQIYRLLSDLFMRGSELRGARAHSQFLGDSVLGELYHGLEYGFLDNPTCQATGLFWVLSNIKSEELGGPGIEKAYGSGEKLLMDLFPLIKMARGDNQVTDNHIWQKIQSFSLKYLPARRNFMLRMELKDKLKR